VRSHGAVRRANSESIRELPQDAEANMTVLEVLQSSTGYLQKRAIEHSRLNAEHLLAHVLGRKRLELYLEFERQLSEAELVPLRDFVRRRGQGEPLQHLLGTVEFCGHTFLCDRRALVPRPETEQLVELLQSKIQNPQCEIVDVGTGSGVIAISLAARFPEARVHAVDISDDALALARENVNRLELSNRINFVKGSLLQPLDGTFDLIVANLPYVARTERDSLTREVLHDPEVALFAGQQGDEVIRELIEQAPARLRPAGLLALEIGLGQEKGVCDFLSRNNYHDIESKTDYSGTPRFVFSRYG
jgi:release factor glutamine methyltransferase